MLRILLFCGSKTTKYFDAKITCFSLLLELHEYKHSFVSVFDNHLPPDRKMTQFLRNFLVGTHLPIVGTNLLIFPMIKNNIHFLKTQILWKS